jgi:two-component SAPR family response regulator
MENRLRIKAILVDDDKVALQILEHDLKEHPEIKIEALFTDPLAALDKIEEIKPDVVFLDIDMPQLKGIDAASQIMDIYSDTEIIFVTSHSRYAVDAFDVNAFDYLVKPVSIKRLEKTIQKLLHRKKTLFNSISNTSNHLVLNGFLKIRNLN